VTRETALERRKVAALERIADALERMMGEDYGSAEAGNDDHGGSPAAPEAPGAGWSIPEETSYKVRGRYPDLRVERDPDYIEPMNGND